MIITTPFKYNDGGRKASGFETIVGDCAVRAIAIATDKPYQEVYDEINILGSKERITKRKRGKSRANTGVYIGTIRKYMENIGWKWTPTMFIGSGCKVHLCKEELPNGRLVVNLSKHLTAVIDGVINDIFQPARGGTRCVYGYWSKN